MRKNNTILVVADPTAKEQPAVERAAWLADKLGCNLELFICDYDQYLAGERFFDTKALQKAREGLIKRHLQRLEKLAAPLRDKGISVAVDAVWDHPLHEGILRKIESTSPRLVFKDTHYHSVVRRSLFSNTDWHVIRECRPPLWLVKPSKDVAVSSILAAVDPVHDRDKPAKLDHKILRTAEEIRAAIDGKLHIVHAFDPAPIYAVSTDAMSFPITEPINEAVAELKSHHQAAMNELTEKLQPPPASVQLADGETREVLIGAVQKLKAEVLVIGAVARGALQRLVLGSTAERVLDHVPCDLLIVKPD